LGTPVHSRDQQGYYLNTITAPEELFDRHRPVVGEVGLISAIMSWRSGAWPRDELRSRLYGKKERDGSQQTWRSFRSC
jgi:hypothetical protein